MENIGVLHHTEIPRLNHESECQVKNDPEKRSHNPSPSNKFTPLRENTGGATQPHGPGTKDDQDKEGPRTTKDQEYL